MVKNVITTPGINQKLTPKYKGPYVVESVLDRDRYVIKDRRISINPTTLHWCVWTRTIKTVD